MPVPAGPGFVPSLSGPIVYDPVLSRVRLTITGVTSLTGTVRVERSTDQVRWTVVRGGNAVPVVGGTVRLDDYEFAADVPNWYRVLAPVALNSNPYFETDAANWLGLGGTAVRSTAQAHEGVASLRVTPDGVSSTVRAESEPVPVRQGERYPVAAWVRSAVARDVEINAAWFTAAAGFISISATPKPVPAGTWTYLATEYGPPEGASLGKLQIRLTGTPPASHTVNIDEAVLADPAGTALFQGVITPTLDRVWLKSIARPFLNRAVTVVDYSDVERPSRAGVFDVQGRSFPVAVTDVRGSRRWTLEVLTETAGDAQDVDLLLASGDILLVQPPAGTEVPGGYVLVGDTRQRRTARRSVRRVFELPCTEVAAPGADVVGATATCQTVLNAYPTCTAVLAAHPTCLSLMELIGDPTEVIVP